MEGGGVQEGREERQELPGIKEPAGELSGEEDRGSPDLPAVLGGVEGEGGEEGGEVAVEEREGGQAGQGEQEVEEGRLLQDRGEEGGED